MLESHERRETHSRILIPVLALLFLSFFHVRWQYFASTPLFWEGDDGCYLQRAAGFVGGDLGPDVCRKAMNYFAPGASVLLIPAGILSRLSVLIFSGSFSEWMVCWACLFGFAFWAGAVVLTDLLLSQAVPEHAPRALATFALNLIPPTFYYAIHRQTLSHPEEWLVAVAFLVFLQARKFIPAIAAAILLSLIRYNDAPALLMVAGALWEAKAAKKFRIRFTPLLGLAVAAAVAILGYVVWLAALRGYGDSGGNATLLGLLSQFSLRGAGLFLVGWDWGILWTAPWFAAILIWGLARVRHLSWSSRGALAWVLLEVVLCMSWGGNGGMYGYRYLTGSYAGLIWVALELVLRYPARAKVFRLASAAAAAWNLWLIHMYIGLSTLDIGFRYARDDLGLVHRVASAPFLRTALDWALSGSVHLAVFAGQSPLVVWLGSLTGVGAGAVPRLTGPTLWMLTASVGVALVILGLALTKTGKRYQRFPAILSDD